MGVLSGQYYDIICIAYTRGSELTVRIMLCMSSSRKDVH
jgi:hypothetical protein